MSFICAICQREIDMRWNRAGPDAQIPPVCRYCERQYSRGVGKPQHGSFRDRREWQRGVALAEALHVEAMRKTWRFDYATS